MIVTIDKIFFNIKIIYLYTSLLSKIIFLQVKENIRGKYLKKNKKNFFKVKINNNKIIFSP